MTSCFSALCFHRFGFVLRLIGRSLPGVALGGLLLAPAANAAVPVITSPTTATAIAGVPFSYQITATNAPDRFKVVGVFPGLSANFLTGILSGTFADLGAHVLDLSATNASGTGYGTLTLTVIAPDSYAAWVLTNGLTGPAAEPTADPDNDGLPNLLEFALGADPFQSSAQAIVPSIDPDTNSLALTYRRSKNAGVTWHYWMSSDLIAWESVELTPNIVDPDLDGDGQAELASVLFPLAAGDTRKFARLAVTIP